MSKIFTAEENGITINITVPDEVPRIAADGFGPSLFGFPMTTLSLYQQQLSDAGKPNVQERKVVASFSIPTVTLIELAQNIQKTLLENKEAIDSSFDGMRKVLEKKV